MQQITSESVKIGHPDIVADSIAANIIAAIISEEHKICMDKKYLWEKTDKVDTLKKELK